MKRLLQVGGVLSFCLILAGCGDDSREGLISDTVGMMNQAATEMGNIQKRVNEAVKKFEDGKTPLRDRLLTSTDRVGKLATIPVVVQAVNKANTMPSRAFTSWMLETVFSYRTRLSSSAASQVASTTTGISSSINALGPCFISPAG